MESHSSSGLLHIERLNTSLQDRVCERLGLAETPPANLFGLQTVYRAWCLNVPFDNVRKMIALRTEPNRPLPGNEAEDFFTHWLRDGVGGTCWPTSNALFVLLQTLGFDARRVAGSMHDQGILNHGSVKVRLEGRDWLVDSSVLCNVPLPLGDEVFVSDDPVWAMEVEPTDGTHVIWIDAPPLPNYLPCRLLVNAADDMLYQERYEASRERSPFNQRLYARRNYPGELRILLGNTRFAKTANGLTVEELAPEALCQALQEDIGLSASLVEQWVQSGSLAASLEPPQGPAPPPLLGQPPSRR